MMRLFCVLAIIALLTGIASAQMIEAPAAGVQHRRMEFIFSLPDGAQGNPYDPDKISVIGVIETPAGSVRQPAFYYSKWEAEPHKEEHSWRLRFTPEEPGVYHLRVMLIIERGQPRQIAEAEFEVTAAPGDGFIRRQGRNFVNRDGQVFFPVGANLGWGDHRAPSEYFQKLEALARNGGNTVRIWLAPWWIRLEPQAGVFDQRAADLLDEIMEKAESLGLRVVLCIEQHGNLQKAGDEIGQWIYHPYNAANGGPCETPSDFFTNAAARQLFRNRLRYIVARWGYSTSLLSWELFNEVEYSSPGKELESHWGHISRWHIEMADYLYQTDPFGRPVSTSSEPYFQVALVRQGKLDMVQRHVYQDWDLPGAIAKALNSADRLEAPAIIGEFGVRGVAEPSFVTRGIFAAAMRGCGALPWIQDIQDPLPFLKQLRPFSEFAQLVPWKELDHSANSSVSDTSLKALARAGKRDVIAFVYAEIASEADIVPVECTLAIASITPGSYNVECWDARTGQVLSRLTLPATEKEGLRVPLTWAGHEQAIRAGLGEE